MSNSKTSDKDLHKLEDTKVLLMHEAPIPQGGYNLIFSEETAQKISEFVATDLFKTLKRTYALQKKDLIARQALNAAHDVPWLHYYKGMAAIVDLFFKDMEATAKAVSKDEDTDQDDE